MAEKSKEAVSVGEPSMAVCRVDACTCRRPCLPPCDLLFLLVLDVKTPECTKHLPVLGSVFVYTQPSTPHLLPPLVEVSAERSS